MAAPIKNATSESRNVFPDIQKTLAKHGVREISYRYESNGSGRIEAIEFAIEVNGQLIPFRLPARVKNVELIMYGKRTPTTQQREQAYRTAWANLRDWIAAQFALIQTGMVTKEEVFLPYMLEPTRQQTLYEAMVENQFLLASPKTKE